MTEHATLLLDSIVQSISAVQGLNICEVVMLHIVGDEYWPGYISRCELGGTSATGWSEPHGNLVIK